MRSRRLRRGGKSGEVAASEVDAANGRASLARAPATTPTTRAYFDVTSDSSLDAFAVEAPRHPVFLVTSS
jgi:hypothetical protein